jgi:hypothetical protein
MILAMDSSSFSLSHQNQQTYKIWDQSYSLFGDESGAIEV